ncbi:hypothetical protein IT084_10290 [Desulfallas sp. Bu1-1]|uniref:hypothetical protein n=1 Tax=Desulfallas sp. Bu1-1 TaxID=2787620 RepID=UPI00189C965E|nr:hypothetical protein [Desulfallas sp. Bu1-1]MBF7083362.1 hypothetical protein [Desulfallas sp. Bu1-1]
MGFTQVPFHPHPGPGEGLVAELLLRTPPPTIEQANEYPAALITQDYHRRIHSSTGRTPEERFLSFPPEYRRFVSDKALTMIFLPFEKSHVTKTGLIRIRPVCCWGYWLFYFSSFLLMYLPEISTKWIDELKD